MLPRRASDYACADAHHCALGLVNVNSCGALVKRVQIPSTEGPPGCFLLWPGISVITDGPSEGRDSLKPLFALLGAAAATELWAVEAGELRAFTKDGSSTHPASAPSAKKAQSKVTSAMPQ